VACLLVVMVKSEPNEKKETSNMADFNFEEFSDVFEDTQEPIDFESLSDVVDVIGETIDTRARQSAMEAKFQETKPQAVDTFMDSLTERLISLEKFSPTAYKAVKDEGQYNGIPSGSYYRVGNDPTLRIKRGSN